MVPNDVQQDSPSNCTYCYCLDCTIRIESNSTMNRKGTITSKNATLTVGRNLARQIVLQVELAASRGQPTVASYNLVDCVLHRRNIAQGRASIEVPDRKLVVQLSNCAPRKLNVFLKSLQAKLDIMLSDHRRLTSVNHSVSLSTYGRNQLQDLPSLHTVLSPLSVDEIRKVRKLRGVSDSPLCSTPKAVMSSSVTLPSTPKLPVKGFSAVLPRKHLEFARLSHEQRIVVHCALNSPKNLFFTGGAGTGKSLVLRRIIDMLPATTTFVTAATGVAAYQLGGVTLHSFAGIGVGRGTNDDCLRIALSKKNIVKQWKLCSHLIIDEISMVDANFFTKIEYVARKIREDNRPFGGIKIIITGDFLQLPPVGGKNNSEFCFECEAWKRCIQKIILLETVRRQDDLRFIKLLEKIRVGQCTNEICSALSETKQNNFSSIGVVPTRLCTHTTDATAVNTRYLDELEGPSKTFDAEDTQFIPDSIQCAVAKRLVLKVLTQVMLLRNIDLARGLSNGSRGVITKFSKNGFPVVRFLSTQEEIEILPVRFSVRIPGYEEPACRQQIPLQHAWAISIHKSQGLTLDAVEVSLERVFAEGQSYVALSRARSLTSLRVITFDPSAIRANQSVVKYYESIKKSVALMDDDENFVIWKHRKSL